MEKYKFKKKIDEIQATEQKRKDARDANVKPERRTKHAPISPSNRDRLLEAKKTPLDRGATPERMTYEASIDLSGAEESGLEQIDEDEWTDRNFGNSTANDVNTSDDSISDLESDDDRIKASVAAGAGGPLTVGETRRLAREWRNRYKGGTTSTLIQSRILGSSLGYCHAVLFRVVLPLLFHDILVSQLPWM